MVVFSEEATVAAFRSLSSIFPSFDFNPSTVSTAALLCTDIDRVIRSVDESAMVTD